MEVPPKPDGRAAAMAGDFWERVAQTDAIGDAMRRLAIEMAARVGPAAR